MSCWQLIYSRFAFCLKRPTSPAWKATMFSLGQQNRANAAFIFHPNPRWGRYGYTQSCKYSQPHGWQWILLCSCITSSNSQLEVSQLIKRLYGALKNKTKKQKRFLSLPSPVSKIPPKNASQKVKQQSVVLLKLKNVFFLTSFLLSANVISTFDHCAMGRRQIMMGWRQ